MFVRVVPPEMVPQRWSEVEPWFRPGMNYAQGDYELAHIQMYLSQGQWALFIIEDGDGTAGAVAVQFFNRPTSRVAFVTALGGRLVLNPDTFGQLKAICKQYGATHFEGAVRESVARLCSRLGLAEKYRIVGVEL